MTSQLTAIAASTHAPTSWRGRPAPAESHPNRARRRRNARAVAAGSTCFRTAYARMREAESALEAGTPARELEVLVLVAEGHTNREIGRSLYMSDKTASVHVSRILGKLSVRNRGEEAAAAHRLGLTR